VKFKLDENIGTRGQNLLRTAGHDVATVHDEALCGATDDTIFLACMREQRALITLDHDCFPPETAHGIVILELLGRITEHGIIARLSEFLACWQRTHLAVSSGLRNRDASEFISVIGSVMLRAIGIGDFKAVACLSHGECDRWGRAGVRPGRTCH